MGREDPQLKLRLTEDMKAAVTDAARANGRSVNAEIVFRLESSFATKGKLKDKLQAIADGTYRPDPTPLDIFDDGHFNEAALVTALREMAAQIASLRHEVKRMTASKEHDE